MRGPYSARRVRGGSTASSDRGRAPRFGYGLVLPILGAACGSGSPVGGTFTVDFPTVADAVAATTVQVFVYPYSPQTSCQVLFEDRRTMAMPPSNMVTQTSPVSPCDLVGGTGSLSVPFGDYSFLAVAQASMGTDLLIGCAQQTISDTNSVVSIPLTLANAANAVPGTSCTMLSSFCSKQCK